MHLQARVWPDSQGDMLDTTPQERTACCNESDPAQRQAIDHQLIVDSLVPQIGEGGAVRSALLGAGNGSFVRRIGCRGMGEFIVGARKSNAGAPGMKFMPALLDRGIHAAVPVPEHANRRPSTPAFEQLAQSFLSEQANHPAQQPPPAGPDEPGGPKEHSVRVNVVAA